MSSLAPLLQSFFTDRLIRQRQASDNTIAAYRDTIRLLIVFAAQQTNKPPSSLAIDDIDAHMIGNFLEHLQTGRNNSIRTRNARLTAIRSLFRYAALIHPEYAHLIQRVLSIPPKRFETSIVTYLNESEVKALLNAPDQTTWIGRRDHALLNLACQTGLRATEIVNLRIDNLHLGTAAHVNCVGKGRKQRITPLTTTTVDILRAWLTQHCAAPADPVFPIRRGTPMSRDALARLVARHTTTAAADCPTLTEKNVTPHTLRHTAAMRLLNAGIDTTVLALWLGHANTNTVQTYIHADLALKERAIARTAPLDAPPGRYQPNDTILTFLNSL